MVKSTTQSLVDIVRTAIPLTFQEVQKSSLNHRKHAIALRKIQERCAQTPSVSVLDASTKLQNSSENETTGEELFNREFARNVNKVLPVKKKEPNAERVIKFVATFVAYTKEKDLKTTENATNDEDDDEEDSVSLRFVEFLIKNYLRGMYTKEKDLKTTENATNDEDDDEEDSVSLRFVEFLIKNYLRGMDAKDKPVRLRVCQIIALCMQNLGAIQDDIYQALKVKLMDRVRDKEPAVRVHVVAALSKIQGDEEDSDMVTEILIDLLQHDPSAEVRRTVLEHIDANEESKAFILERASDQDVTNRKMVYLRSIIDIGDFRKLSITERENILWLGLHDREPSVRKACAKMINSHWIPQANNNVIEFLKCLDVVSEMECSISLLDEGAEKCVAEDTLKSFFESNPEFANGLCFDDVYMENLNGETAFLMRVYCEYCKEVEDHARLDTILPEVSKHAYYIQLHSNKLRELSINSNDGDSSRDELEFIVTQLLLIAKSLDFADEIGRRKLFMLLKQMIMLADVPEAHLSAIVDIMRTISLNERDFTRIMVETISDIREQFVDGGLEEDGLDQDGEGVFDEDRRLSQPQQSEISLTAGIEKLGLGDAAVLEVGDVAGGEKGRRYRELVAQYNCLCIAKCMLQKSEESLRENSSMYGILNELIIPAVENVESETLCQIGLACLGLCCLLDKSLAHENVKLFIQSASTGSAEARTKALMIITDLALVFGLKSLSTRLQNSEEIVNLLQNSLLGSRIPEDVRTVAGIAIAKLLFTGMLREEKVLQSVVVLYFHPSIAENQRLRQCFSYFLPVFCQSRHENQAFMARVFVPVLKEIIRIHKEEVLNADEDENDGEDEDGGMRKKMLSPLQIANVLIDWTDPAKIVTPPERTEPEGVDYGTQSVIAIDLLKATFDESSANRKLFFQIINKLRVDERWGRPRLNELLLLLTSLKQNRTIGDAATRNNVNKFESAILSFIPEPMDEQEMIECAVYQDILRFVDSKCQEIPGETVRRRAKPQRKAKEASEQASNVESDDDSDFDPAATKPARRRGTRTRKAKEVARLENEIDELLDSD